MKEYEFLSHKIDLNFFEECIKELKNPCGLSLEVGVLRGGSSKLIIENYKKIHNSLLHFHIGIDHYPSRPATDDRIILQKTIADNKDDNFIFVYMPIEIYMEKFIDGYPLYFNSKKIETFYYDLVHLDGPNKMNLVLKQLNFFSERINKNGFIILDDIDTLNIELINNYMRHLNFKLFKKGTKKIIYQKNDKN